MRYVLILIASLFVTPALGQQAKTPAQQFEDIKALKGLWSVAETERLTIRFELTANNTVVLERWETSSGLHSLTAYHMDGANIVATHYCPQGNQPRLVASAVQTAGKIAFAFQDATDLDATEEFQHDLAFEIKEGGTVVRSEIYSTDKATGPVSSYTLSRAS